MLAGELASAHAHLEQGIAVYEPQQHRAHAFLYGGHDPSVCCRCHDAWCLRTLSLSRLYHQQGKAEEARPMLAEIYGWFKEGFDTMDLREAEALLQVIRAKRRTPGRP